MVVVVTTQRNVLVPAMWVLWSRGASKAALLELVHGVRARVGQYRGASAVFGIIRIFIIFGIDTHYIIPSGRSVRRWGR